MVRFAWGLEDYESKGPIIPIPEGRVKLRRRPADFVKLFVKKGDSVKLFRLKYDVDHWVPALIAENQLLKKQ